MVDLIKAYQDGKKHVNVFTEKYQIKDMKPAKTIEPFILSVEDLKQYEDEYLYEFEKRLRKYFEIKMKDKNWCENMFARRYTYGMLVQELFGRPYDCKIDGGKNVVCQMISYYCSQVKKNYWDPVKKQTKNTNCYWLSPSRYRKVKPFSLRLQAEMVMERGELPSRHNVRRKPYLKPGQARNRRTQENIKRRSERAKKAYNERQRKYRASKKRT